MVADVMVSYASDDKQEAERIVNAFPASSLSFWYDQREQDALTQPIPAGSDLEAQLAHAIDEAAVFVVIESNAWYASKTCGFEYQHAIERGKRIIAASTADLSPSGTALIAAAARIPIDDTAGLQDAIEDGLDVAQAQSRILMSVIDPRSTRRGRPEAASGRDADLFTRSDTARLGIEATDEVVKGIEEAFKNRRRWRKRVLVAATCVLALALAGTLVAVISSQQANSGRNAAASDARFQQSLAAAVASENTGDSRSALKDAEEAVELKANATSVSALRQAIALFKAGTELQVPTPGVPLASFISNSGQIAAYVAHGGSLVIVRTAQETRSTVLGPSRADAGLRLAGTANGSFLAVVRRDDDGLEFIETSTGRVSGVLAEPGIADVVFEGSTRAIVVLRSGAVLVTSPTLGRPTAEPIGTVPGGNIRAATITNIGAHGSITLATLDDAGTVSLTSLPQGATIWSRPLGPAAEVQPLVLGAYTVGQDFVRVCGDQLSVLTVGQAPDLAEGFAIPFSITKTGSVTETGSLIRSFGIACMPDGSAIAIDPLEGQESFPANSPDVLNFASNTSNHAIESIASSQNDEWMVSFGSDGSMNIRSLDNVAQYVRLSGAVEVAPGKPYGVVADPSGQLTSVTPGQATQDLADPGVSGTPARGAYYEPGVGGIFGIGRHLVAVHDNRARIVATLPFDIIGIRETANGQAVVATSSDRERVAVISLVKKKAPQIENIQRDGVQPNRIYDFVELRTGDFAIATTNGQIHIRTPTGAVVANQTVGPSGRVVLEPLPDGSVLAGTNDGKVRLLSGSLQQIRVISAVTGPIADLEVSRDGKLAVALGFNDYATVISLPSLTVISRYGPIQGLDAVAFSAGNSNLLFGATTYIPGGGGTFGSVGVAPVCEECAEAPASLLHLGHFLLVQTTSGGRMARFVPASTPASTN